MRQTELWHKKTGIGLEPKPRESLSAITLLKCSPQNSWGWRILKTHMQAQSTVIDHINFWARQKLGLEHFSPPTLFLCDWWSHQTSPGLLTARQSPENCSSYQRSQSQNRICLCAGKSWGFCITPPSLSPSFMRLLVQVLNWPLHCAF